ATQWKGIGLRNIRQAGYESIVEFHEARSEFLLPTLVQRGTRLEFALIDGWHTFDQVMVEFYFVNRLLRTGGVVVFDDADRPSVNRAIRHALTYPAYKLLEGSSPASGSLLGAARRSLRHLPYADQLFRRDFLYRDWDLGLAGSCVAIQKISEDHRSSGWDACF